VLIIVFGASLCALPFWYRVEGMPRMIDLFAGSGAVIMAAIYLASPTWRSYIVIDERGLALQAPRGEKLRIDWDQVVEVIVDDEEPAAFVRGPSGGRSFLLPSDAHPAPYRVDRPRALLDLIVSALPPDKVRHSKVFQ
jgi:hypothetical protein